MEKSSTGLLLQLSLELPIPVVSPWPSPLHPRELLPPQRERQKGKVVALVLPGP